MFAWLVRFTRWRRSFASLVSVARSLRLFVAASFVSLACVAALASFVSLAFFASLAGFASVGSFASLVVRRTAWCGRVVSLASLASFASLAAFASGVRGVRPFCP